MRASRLLSVLLLLQVRGRMTAGQLAAEVGVSVRTVYRDIEALSAAGVPVYADRGPAGGYCLLAGYRTRLTGLTGGEAESLPFAGMPGPADELGLGAALATAQLKLAAALPDELRARAERSRERFHLDAPGWFRDAEPTPHLAALADAVWNCRLVRVRYRRTWAPREVDRTLQPLGVVLKAGTWYLVAARADTLGRDGVDGGDDDGSGGGGGSSSGSGDDRAGRPRDGRPLTYRVGQILGCEPLPDGFDRPGGFDLAAFWQEWSRRFEADRFHAEMVLRLSPDGVARVPTLLGTVSAQAVRRTAGPPDAEGWVRVVLPVETLRHAQVEALKLGAEAEVLQPAELREAMAGAAAAMAGRYRATGLPTTAPGTSFPVQTSAPAGGREMSTVEKSIDVDVPVSTAYNQWTQFESFPQFMQGVDRIEQVSDTTTHWVTSIGGVHREFDAEITEQHPDERVAWTSVDGPKQAGVVTFHRLAADRTRLMLQLDYEPEGLVENVGDKLGIIGRRAEADLKRFKEFIESRGGETGGWRGDVQRPTP